MKPMTIDAIIYSHRPHIIVFHNTLVAKIHAAKSQLENKIIMEFGITIQLEFGALQIQM